MKEQILPELPIVGHLKLTTQDGKTLSDINVVDMAPAEELQPFFQECYEELHRFLTGQQKEINIPLDTSGLKPFQKMVLEVMAQTPYGEVTTYKSIAEKLNSKAYQAIGSACGKNPFILIYPCHRIIGSKDIGGFAHGLKMKKDLLKLEGAIPDRQ